MKRTKIVCTIGPASEDKKILRAMLKAGMNVARINLSHGSYEEHRQLIKEIREVAAEADVPLAVMVDTKGAGIRTGRLRNNKVKLKEGDKITLTEQNILGDEQRISVNLQGLAQRVHPGQVLWLQNGEIGLEVIAAGEGEITCKVKNTGILGENKRINIPGVSLSAVADEADIKFAADVDVDYLAASFIRSAQEILEIKELLKGDRVQVIAKIETREAVEHMDEIIEAADGVMVARGDLGVEIPLEEVPLVQKELVRKCNEAGKPVIVATQMLKSMVQSPSPTRAEVADVANAILDGADAVMLSEETAVGDFPVETVQMMSKIAQKMSALPLPRPKEATNSVTEAIGESACRIAENIKAAAIISSTRSGATAKLVAKFRPKAPIIAITYSDKVRNSLALVWGVYPIKIPFSPHTDEMVQRSLEAAKQLRLVKEGDTVILTAGSPYGVPGTTNKILVERV